MSLSVLRRIVSEELQVGLAGAGRQAQALRTALFNRLSTEPRWGRYTSTESLTRRLTQEAYKMSEWYDAVNSLRETDGPAESVLAQLGAIVEDVAVSWMRNRDKVSKRDVRLGESSQLAQEKNMLTEKKLRQIIRRVIAEHEMSIDTLVKPKVTGSDACPDCRGTGKYVPAFGATRNCDTCHGTGSSGTATPSSHFKGEEATEEELEALIKISQQQRMHGQNNDLAMADAWELAYEYMGEHDNIVDHDAVMIILPELVDRAEIDQSDEGTIDMLYALIEKELQDTVDRDYAAF